MIESKNGVMFQFFHWHLDKDDSFHANKSLWSFLQDEADHLRDIGIDAVWIPPAYKGASGDESSGYDVYDHFDLGEFNSRNSRRTKYGDVEQLHAAIHSLHGYIKDEAGGLVQDGTKRYIQVYGDIVLNHRSGGSESDFWQAVRVEKDDREQERWEAGFESGLIDIQTYTRFDFPERGEKYSSFKWSPRHFDSVDTTVTIKQCSNTFTETGGKEGKYIYRFVFNEPGHEPQAKNFEKWVSLEKGN